MADARGEMVPQLGDEWDLAKSSLKFNSRYFNNDIRNFLDTIFSGVEIIMDYNRQSIITEIDQDSPDIQVFRARHFGSKEDAKKAIDNNELGPPSVEKSKAGRMNVAGIPVFYGATTERLALTETRPPVGSYVVVAQFEVLEPFKLLNLGGFGSITHEMTNYFDMEDEMMHLVFFLNEFCREITKTASPKEEPLQYIVTQAISEYLANISNIDIHGILYDSSQAIKTQEYEKNIMLFSKFSDIYETSNGRSSILRMYENSPIIYVITGAGFDFEKCIAIDSKTEF